jgi:epoxyqueuosine reductase QueG
MEDLSRLVIEFAKCQGACAAGIATRETLAQGPPSTDLTYVLPQAKSAVSFAFPLNQDLIPPFLMKKDRRAHEKDNLNTNSLAGGLSLQLAKWLDQKGCPSLPQAPNDVYRRDTPRGALDMLPEISHRYLAVRSGVGFFGLSGNILTREHGAAVILGSVITTAELTPTEPISEAHNYCDECRLCMASCASGLMSDSAKTKVQLGGAQFSYAERKNYLRCEYVCGGFTGLHPDGKWSTWSPGRFHIPDRDEDFLSAIIQGVKAYGRRPPIDGGYHHSLMPGTKLWLTCGNCQLVCHPDKKERQRRYQMLKKSGVVIQHQDGILQAVPPEEAISHIDRMDKDIKALYVDPTGCG